MNAFACPKLFPCIQPWLRLAGEAAYLVLVVSRLIAREACFSDVPGSPHRLRTPMPVILIAINDIILL